MTSQSGAKYQLARRLCENPSRLPTEAEVQALWFEQWLKQPLVADTGEVFAIIQPGLWNHGAGPDFFQAALQMSDGTLEVGSVEVHLRATDWEVHQHGSDPAYENCLLHVIWERPSRPYFPATRTFRRVRQVVLPDHLMAPWEELSESLDPLLVQDRPTARPGPCQRELQRLSAAQQRALLREAGAYRLRRKAERWQWRSRAANQAQALWEALAEGLGYAPNKVPFRLVAQRLPIAFLQSQSSIVRTALIYGVAGFLPAGDLTQLPAPLLEWVRPVWDEWWKWRDSMAHKIIPRTSWTLRGVRPLNRPERRLAALTALAGAFRAVEPSLEQGNVERFTDCLLNLTQGVWKSFATYRAALPQPQVLLGRERVQDLVTNVFLPFALNHQGESVIRLAEEMRQAPNRSTLIAVERVLGPLSLGSEESTVLIQQGLLQLYQDYCLTDASGCARCPFPEVVRSFENG